MGGMTGIVDVIAVLAAPAAGAFGAWWGGTIAVRTTRVQAEADRDAERERYERERREAVAVLVGDFLAHAEQLRLTEPELTEDGRTQAQVLATPDGWSENPLYVPNPAWSVTWVEVAGMAARIAASDHLLGEAAWSLAVNARDVAHNDVWTKDRETFLNLVRQRG